MAFYLLACSYSISPSPQRTIWNYQIVFFCPGPHAGESDLTLKASQKTLTILLKKLAVTSSVGPD